MYIYAGQNEQCHFELHNRYASTIFHISLIGNIGGETGKQYDPDEIGYYRRIMERQGPPMVYSNKQLRERLQIEKELGQLRKQYEPPRQQQDLGR